MRRFRIAQDDTVKANILNGNNIIASIYASGYSSIEQVKNELIRRVSYTSAKSLNIQIYIPAKEISKHFKIKVNR